MADYFSDASFMIPCTFAQAAMAVDALTEVFQGDDPSEAVAKALAKPLSEYISPREVIIREMHEACVEICESDFWNMGFEADAERSGIWVRTSDGGWFNTEMAAAFVNAVMCAYNLPGAVIIRVSYSCSKPRLDAYGGHTISVTKNSIRHFSDNEFVNAEESAAEAAGSNYWVAPATGAGKLGQVAGWRIQAANEQDLQDKVSEISTAIGQEVIASILTPYQSAMLSQIVG